MSSAPARRDARRGTARRTRLALACLLGLAACDREEQPDELVPRGPGANVGPSAGRWVVPRSHKDDADLTDEQREAIAGLEAIGYADGVHDAPDESGVTRHDRTRAFAGTNLVTSAHAAHAALMDMEGRTLHEWHYPFREAYPNHPQADYKIASFWRRVLPLPNGDLIAIYEGLGMIRIDRDSKLLWRSAERAHHDLTLGPDGEHVYVLTREAHLVDEVSADVPVLEDFVSLVDVATGLRVRRFSLIEAMEGTGFDQDWSARLALTRGDIFHTNSLEILDGRLAGSNPAFARGNVLLSMLFPNLVAVLDRDTKKIVWGQVGPYAAQHDPQVLDNGTVMVFDNQGAGERSRVLELDPATWEVVWSYEGSAQEPFYSATCGVAQRLANGNTLITESDYGRAFEITREGETVWEYVNPERGGEGGQYIATLMEVLRLPSDFPLDWLE